MTGMGKLVVLLAMLLLLVPFAVAGQQENTGQIQQEIIYAAAPWPPYIEVGEDGVPTGLYIELLEQLFCRKLGYKLTYLNVPWKRAQYELQNGTADVTVTLPIKERLLYTIPTTKPLIELSLHIFTYTGHPLLQKIQRIAAPDEIRALGLVPVTNIGNGWHRNEIDSHDINTEYVPTEENAFQMVASRRADITSNRSAPAIT